MYKSKLLRVMNRIGLYREEMGKRLEKTKKLFKHKVYAVDIHTHSLFSDGAGTIRENYEAMKNCALDFVFATDHNSLGQKRTALKLPGMSWGQEPGSLVQHIGLLHPKRKLNPLRDSIAADFERASRLAPFVWIPHPVGWYPNTWYPDQAIKSLWTLPDCFAMEIMNGANKEVNAYDAFDAKAVEVWDKLLQDGRKITSLGGSDAHGEEQIGVVWTGVFAKQRNAQSIIKALNSGTCFASEAPLLEFTGDNKPMGSTLKKRKGSKLHLKYHIADSAGLETAEIISDGKIVKKINAADSPVLTGFTDVACNKPGYFRLQVTASDKRRAFSTPLYINVPH